jgi:dTDP-4-amino-4,6-dideoxy-D-glucose acyltransferase
MSEGGFLCSRELESLGFSALGRNVRVDASARFYGVERISIGSDTRIDAYSVISAGAGGVAIGSHVHIAAFVFLAGTERIEIGDFAGLSGRASIYSSNDDYSGRALTGPTIPDELRRVHAAPVHIGRHVVVGAGSIVLPGVSIGEGAAVGALSLVKHDVAPFAIVVGTDGRVIGERSRDLIELERRLDP